MGETTVHDQPVVNIVPLKLPLYFNGVMSDILLRKMATFKPIMWHISLKTPRNPAISKLSNYQSIC